MDSASRLKMGLTLILTGFFLVTALYFDALATYVFPENISSDTAGTLPIHFGAQSNSTTLSHAPMSQSQIYGTVQALAFNTSAIHTDVAGADLVITLTLIYSTTAHENHSRHLGILVLKLIPLDANGSIWYGFTPALLYVDDTLPSTERIWLNASLEYLGFETSILFRFRIDYNPPEHARAESFYTIALSLVVSNATLLIEQVLILVYPRRAAKKPAIPEPAKTS